MMRWGHGHSTVLGIVIGVAVIGGHILWALTVALALGILVGRFWGALHELLRRFTQGRPPIIEGRWRR